MPQALISAALPALVGLDFTMISGCMHEIQLFEVIRTEAR